MADNYKVKVKIEIVKCADVVTNEFIQVGVGRFERIISAEQAQNIDTCEQMLLQTNYAALRDAFACHCSRISRQHALELVEELEACEVKPYRVEGEIGRITFDSYWVEPGAGRDETTRCLFPSLPGQEWYRTTGFKEIGLVHGTVEDSYRKSSVLINRVRHQEGATPDRTLRENSEYEGRQIMAYMAQQAGEIFDEQGFTAEGLPTERAVDRREQRLVTLPPRQVAPALQACAPDPEWETEMTNNQVAASRELTTYLDQELKLTLSEEKTTIVHAREGFDFLGVRTFIAPQRSNPTKILPYQEPAQKSIKAYRQKVKDLTHTNLDYLPPGERIRALNWQVVGWANYHRWGNAKRTFSALSYWTNNKIYAMLRRYGPTGKRAAYRKYFRPVSDCTNLQRWQQYTNWLIPSVRVDEEIRLGVLPMSIISTSQYWQYRGKKIPPAYQLLSHELLRDERETEFYTDLEAIETTIIGQASRWTDGKYGQAYFHNRKVVLQRDKYTCTACGYKSQRQKGEVHDLEIHHIKPEGDYKVDNLQTVCIPCHQQLTVNKQAD